MVPWLILLIAAISTAICLFLWFRDVRKIMSERKSTVESAGSQLESCLKKAARAHSDPSAAAILERSERIYQQAVDIYDQTIRKPWVFLPALTMGFRPSQKGKRLVKERSTGYWGSVCFFKNLILLTVIVLIAVPTGGVIHLSGNLKKTEALLLEQTEQARDLRQENETLSQAAQAEALRQTEKLPSPSPSTDPPQQSSESLSPGQVPTDPHVSPPENEQLQAESPYAQLYPDFYAPAGVSGTGTREDGVIYLTFDDGPSARTGEVLDILKEKDVKATFFVVESKSESAKQFLRRIVEEGHTLAMHSYSHDYVKIYASVEAYLDDMYQIFTQIKEATGVAPTLFRFPGGSINSYNRGIYQELISEMLRRGFIPYDWNLSSADAVSGPAVPPETLIDNVLSGAKNAQRGIVLMHDSVAKTTTVQALSSMIDGLRELGFELRALTPEVMPILFGYQDQKFN